MMDNDLRLSDRHCPNSAGKLEKRIRPRITSPSFLRPGHARLSRHSIRSPREKIRQLNSTLDSRNAAPALDSTLSLGDPTGFGGPSGPSARTPRAEAPFYQARALAGLARLKEAEEDLPAARELFEQVVSFTRQHGLSYICVRALHGLAGVLRSLGQTSEPKALLEEALQAAEAAGDDPGIGLSLFLLGQHLKMEGEHERASALHHQALEFRRRAQDASGLADSLETLAGLMAQARRQAAARLLGAAKSLREVRHAHESGCPCCHQDIEVVLDHWSKAAFLKTVYGRG